MKTNLLRLFVVVVSLFSLNGALSAASDFNGKILNAGAGATVLETGKWYLLYNAYTSSFTKEGDGNTLSVSTSSPSGLDAAENAGYLVMLESAGEDGKYYIKSGLGNYYRNVTTKKNNGTEDAVRATSIYTIETLGTNGHWTLRSNALYYLTSKDGTVVGSASKGSLNSDRDWAFREVELKDVSELTGTAYVKYVLSKGGLVRLTNKRLSAKSLGADESRTFGVTSDKEDLSQVWILSKNGDGYNLLNGSTGRFLSSEDNYRTPSQSAKKQYIQMSPNNKGEECYINISEKSDFSGNNCLNLNGDGVTLYKWSCAGDPGSDWTISVVDNFTQEEVEAGLLEKSDYSVPTAGKYYRIRNMGYDIYLNEDFSTSRINCESKNDAKLSQFWTLVETGTEGTFYIKNLCTEKYVARQGGARSNQYWTQTVVPAQGFTMKRTEDGTRLLYYVVDQGAVGFHCDSGRRLVGWDCTGIPASTWGFEEVTLTDEFIENGRGILNTFTDLKNNIAAYQTSLDNLFEDKACTTLKPSVTALSDEELSANEDFNALNADMKAMVLKVKNDTWQTYTSSNGYSRGFEKFFRVRNDYKVYSHFQKMAWNEYTGMSNSYGKLSGPTGITGKAGDIIYIYVGEEPSADCTLQVEIVGDSESPGDHQTGATTDLHKGLNAIILGDRSTLYIFYQLNDPEKYLADYPDMNIHIEGGEVQGYWDSTRGMTNDDWALLREKLLDKSEVINMKTPRLVFVMSNQYVQNAVGKEMEGIMRVWNTILQNEEDLMGFQDDLEGRFNNIWNCFSINHAYMYATTYGTYYENGTLTSVLNYNSMTNTGGGVTWGPSHEMGHNHQNSICAVGTMEASNNFFSNVNVYLHGVSTSRGTDRATVFSDFAKGKPWNERGIWAMAQFYYQLYLYYHVQGYNPEFYPRLFSMLRKDPLSKGSWDGSLSADSDGDGTMDIQGGFRTLGKNDYLKMAKKMCDAAGQDLSELFEAYGMFVPVSNLWIGDYSNYWMFTTQEDIDEAKAYMSRYPKAPSIMFVEDRIKESPVLENPPLEGKPQGKTRVAISDESMNLIGTNGDVGQYGDFGDEYMTDGYYYTTAKSQGNTIYSVRGTGAVGFKVYDKDGNLIFISNKKIFTVPEDIQTKMDEGFSIVAAEGNGYEVLVPYGPAAYRGTLTAYYEGSDKPHTIHYYGTGDEGKSVINPLPANSIAYVNAGQNDKMLPTEDLLKQTNVVGADKTAENIVIDGNKPMYIPEAFTANTLSFTKDGEGMQALQLPFDVQEGYVGTIKDDKLVKEAKTILAGSPVVVDGKTQFTRTGAEVKAGDFQTAENGYVLNADGKSVVSADNVSPFVYLFDHEGSIATGINAVTGTEDTENNDVYDLSGRRVGKAATPGIYVIGGRKIVVK